MPYNVRVDIHSVTGRFPNLNIERFIRLFAREFYQLAAARIIPAIRRVTPVETGRLIDSIAIHYDGAYRVYLGFRWEGWYWAVLPEYKREIDRVLNRMVQPLARAAMQNAISRL